MSKENLKEKLKEEVKKKAESSPEDLKSKVHEKGFGQLEEIFDIMMGEAMGTAILVAPTVRKNENPKNADFVAEAVKVRKVCKTCGQPVTDNPPEIWEVWQTRPDTGLLKYLYDHLVGKATMKEEDKIDPIIMITFSDIDCIPNDIHPNFTEEGEKEAEPTPVSE